MGVVILTNKLYYVRLLLGSLTAGAARCRADGFAGMKRLCERFECLLCFHRVWVAD